MLLLDRSEPVSCLLQDAQGTAAFLYHQTTHGDTVQRAEEVANGAVDAALVTLPVKHPDLHVEQVSRDRLVVCLRKDHAMAATAILRPAGLERNLTVLYHLRQHSDAHARLLEQRSEVGIQVEEYSRASHPSELQMLVRKGMVSL
jgi:hypothetical protein